MRGPSAWAVGPLAHTCHQDIRKSPVAQASSQGPKAIVEAAGTTFDDVVTLRAYLTMHESFPITNEAYGAFMQANSPAGALPARDKDGDKALGGFVRTSLQ